ncbi:hypothetical protein Q8A73_010999 [Channa argus]|nr:hypothetical protein Q8A73_010999 [Channa argus]
MAMLRVSSYRKLFEEENWSQNGGLSMQCAGLYRASVRGVVVDKCGCDTIDFEAARSLNKEGMNQFVQDRTTIAALNDRLVRLIELARCFEMENESLECQIVELEEKLNNQQASSSITTAVAKHGYNLAAVVERLRKEKGEIVDETVELHKELEYLKDEYEKAAQQRIFLQQERQDIAEEVDAVTAECLALREQVSIYEEQLDNMEAQDMTAVGRLREPAERMTRAMAAIKFGSPDIAAALDVKEYYCQLAESLQNKCWAATSAVLHSGAAKKLKVRGAAGSRVKDLSKIKNISEIKMLRRCDLQATTALCWQSAPKSDGASGKEWIPTAGEGSGGQLSDSRATVWDILLTRVFTLWTLSAGDEKGSASSQTGFITPSQQRGNWALNDIETNHEAVTQHTSPSSAQPRMTDGQHGLICSVSSLASDGCLRECVPRLGSHHQPVISNQVFSAHMILLKDEEDRLDPHLAAVAQGPLDPLGHWDDALYACSE